MKMTDATLLVSHVERSGGVHATGSRGIRSLVVVSGEVQVLSPSISVTA